VLSHATVILYPYNGQVERGWTKKGRKKERNTNDIVSVMLLSTGIIGH
jgi:hypothetical protein